MAIIYSYPQKTTPAGGDFLIITDSEQPAPNKNRTKSLTIDNLASYVSTSTSGITGSGTLNTIAMFTPNGQAIGDSRITQAALGAGINVNTNLTVSDDLNVTGSIETNSSLTVQGTSTFNNDVTLSNGNALRWTSDDVRIEGTTAGDNIKFYVANTEILQLAQSGTLATVTGNLRVTGAYYDSSNSPGTTGQVLTSTVSGAAWDDATDVVSGAIVKMIPYVTTASSGGSETYSADNNIVKIGWSGGNGTYVINLPSATAIPYRVIRFTTNGTYPGGGSHKVQFTPPVGETIDGAAFFEISKAYEGISIWSTGTEWVVIQAKAH